MAKANPVLPYWKLSGFYFFYFASLGIMLPYWNPYLYSKGFSAAEIGYLTAIVAATKIIAPYLWGWLADRSSSRMQVIQLASFACLLLFPLVIVASNFIWMAAVIFLFSFFWNASLPQFEATTLSHLGEQRKRYSQIRLWGSIGFILAVLLAGYLFDSIGVSYQPYIVLLVFACIFFNSLMVKDKATSSVEVADQTILQQLKKVPVLCLFVACFFMQFSHGAYYTFYSIYLQQHGYSESVTGWLWALGTFAEIFIFLSASILMIRFNTKLLLLICFLFTAIRWLAMAYVVHSLVLLTLIQLLHAFSFGLFHAVAIHLVAGYFQNHLQGRGQALYSATSFGLGGALGALVSGYYWDISTEFTFIIMALAAFAGIFVTFYIKPALDNA